MTVILTVVQMKRKVPGNGTKKKKLLMKMLRDTSLADVWRTLNPLDGDFIFYSNPQNLYSRINFFFVPPQIMAQVTGCSIESTH